MIIEDNRQSAVLGYERRTEASRLADKQQVLLGDLQNNLGDNAKRPGVIVELRGLGDDLIKGQLTERTAKLQAQQRLWDEEFSEKKRQRDRDLYRVHKENYTYNASAAKLVLADKKLSAYTASGQGVSESQFDEINEDIRQVRKISQEETDAARRRKQESRREKQREQLTKIKPMPVFPEPLYDAEVKSLQPVKKKLNLKV